MVRELAVVIDENVLVLQRAHLVIVNAPIVQFFGVMTSLITGRRLRRSTVEEAAVVWQPRGSTEFDPFNFFIPQRLVLLEVLNEYFGPVVSVLMEADAQVSTLR